MALTLEEIRQQWLPELDRRIVASCPGSGLVATMCGYHLGTGGKRLRAVLPVWVCANLGGRPADAVEFGVALELLHNATLIHDDIQDGDTHRRGKPTVWSRWGAPQAINAGDALIFQAMRHFARSPAAAQVVPLVCERMTELIEGQALDLQLQLSKAVHKDGSSSVLPSLEEWMQVARRKTGALFALCFQLGVCAAGVDAQWQIHAAEFGIQVGLAFQVADDLLEFVGEKGRPPGGDLMVGKMSFPVLWAFEHAKPEDVSILRRVMHCGREATTPDMLKEALNVLQRCGAIDATKQWLWLARKQALEHPMTNVVPGVVHEVVASFAQPTADMSKPTQREMHYDA